MAALFVLLAVSGCAQVATGQGQPPYAPYSRDNECSRNFIARSCSEATRLATIEGPHGVDQAPASELPAPLAERFAAAPADALDLARHSLRRPQLARRYPGRQFLCDNPVGDELAEAGAPADFIDDRAAVATERRRCEQWIDRGAREPTRASDIADPAESGMVAQDAEAMCNMHRIGRCSRAHPERLGRSVPRQSGA